MKLFVPSRIEQYAAEHTQPEPEWLTALEARTHAEMKWPQMLTGRTEGRLLKLLVELTQPKLVLEVGTFTGYSALSMAEGLPDGGRIITCEIDAAARDMAQAAFDASPYRDRIELRFGPALDTIVALDEPVDFSFIDADKERYPDYYEAIVERTRPGGVIVVDNVFWSGRVLDADDEESRAIATLNDKIVRDGRVENVLLTVRDGLQLVVKR